MNFHKINEENNKLQEQLANAISYILEEMKKLTSFINEQYKEEKNKLVIAQNFLSLTFHEYIRISKGYSSNKIYVLDTQNIKIQIRYSQDGRELVAEKIGNGILSLEFHDIIMKIKADLICKQ